jgi:hypothetical protein
MNSAPPSQPYIRTADVKLVPKQKFEELIPGEVQAIAASIYAELFPNGFDYDILDDYGISCTVGNTNIIAIPDTKRKLAETANTYHQASQNFNQLGSVLSGRGDECGRIYDSIDAARYRKIATTQLYGSEDNMLLSLTNAIRLNLNSFGGNKIPDIGQASPLTIAGNAMSICISKDNPNGTHTGNEKLKRLVQTKFFEIWGHKNGLKLENSDTEEA